MFYRCLSIFLILFSLTGCTTEYNLATRQEETLLYSTEREIRIGEKVSNQIEKKYDVIDDVEVNERVNRILDRIVAVADREEIVYFIKVLDDDLMNAISLPGGWIYVFRGLIDKAESDDELAGVIAHEVGHITAKHSIKRLQASHGALLLQVASIEAGGRVASGVNFALTSLFLAHSQDDEFESDRLGIKYMRKAGYRPEAMLDFLEKLKKENDRASIRQYSYWRTHPHILERRAIVSQEIKGEMDFRGYVNLIERKEDW